MKFIFIALLLMSSLANATCENGLKPLPSFAQIDAVSTMVSGRRAPEEELRVLWKSGLPYLKQLALESGTSVSGLLADYIAMADLAADLLYPKFAERSKFNLRVAASYLDKVDALVEKDKLKANTWKQLAMVQYALSLLAFYAVDIERRFKASPSINPFVPIDSNYVRQLLTSLEDSTLERLEQIELKARSRRLPHFKLDMFGNLVVKSDDNEKVESSTSEPQADVKSVFDFNSLIRGEGKIDQAQIYTVRTIHGRELQVTFSKDIALEFEGVEKRVIMKLLRGIVFGRGDSAGIKLLPDLGKNIVELKAVMSGAHKRIFGCLEGAVLRLLKFAEIPPTRAAYFKKIPHDLCI